MGQRKKFKQSEQSLEEATQKYGVHMIGELMVVKRGRRANCCTTSTAREDAKKGRAFAIAVIIDGRRREKCKNPKNLTQINLITEYWDPTVTGNSNDPRYISHGHMP